jgi:hypothetical protein
MLHVTQFAGRLVDWKIGRLINLTLITRTYTLNAVHYTQEKIMSFKLWFLIFNFNFST